MHNRPVGLLQAANITGSLVLLSAAISYVAASEWPRAVTATLLTTLFGEHAALQRARASALLRVLTAEEYNPAAAVIGEQLDPARHELAAACCIDSWVSHGRQHDPTLCKEQDHA
ncbi:hypothetical protein [Streptomyces sp.]|uniref:hypothetical protein n=1 Tax=Streptomyces sp. TaxID=1931 RepID=UPI002D796A51|nr:hypothetical protein [Streptomyces sp.]HET6354638.1 hypothetical protein [Streptomyces sp.]